VAGGRLFKASDNEIKVIGALALMICRAISWVGVNSLLAQAAGRDDTMFRR
jgi:hypothetical protein